MTIIIVTENGVIRREENSNECNEKGSEQNTEGYYRCKVKERELYGSLCGLYSPYITKERITQCNHEFDNQVNSICF